MVEETAALRYSEFSPAVSARTYFHLRFCFSSTCDRTKTSRKQMTSRKRGRSIRMENAKKKNVPVFLLAVFASRLTFPDRKDKPKELPMYSIKCLSSSLFSVGNTTEKE